MAMDRIAPILELDNLLSIQSILCCAVYSVRSPVGVSIWLVTSGLNASALLGCISMVMHCDEITDR